MEWKLGSQSIGCAVCGTIQSRCFVEGTRSRFPWWFVDLTRKEADFQPQITRGIIFPCYLSRLFEAIRPSDHLNIDSLNSGSANLWTPVNCLRNRSSFLIGTQALWVCKVRWPKVHQQGSRVCKCSCLYVRTTRFLHGSRLHYGTIDQGS